MHLPFLLSLLDSVYIVPLSLESYAILIAELGDSNYLKVVPLR